MKDKYGREIDYLRISLTDACNLKCVYCMPEHGVKFDNKDGALTHEDLDRIIKIFGRLGTKKLRFTGGEPLLRNDLDVLIATAKKSGIDKIAITTNAILLEDKIDSLVKAGLSEVNISIDTLDAKLFKELTRGGDLSKVLKSLDKCLAHGLKVKVNVVILNEINDKEFIDLCAMSIDKKVDVRFIELMPIGEGIKFKGKTEESLKKELTKSYELTADNQKVVSGPASYIKIKNSKGRVGFISAMSNHFCDSCNRIRITPDGFLKQCLHFRSGLSLKDLINENVDDKVLEGKIVETVFNKPLGHKFNEDKKAEDNRFMFQIGG